MRRNAALLFAWRLASAATTLIVLAVIARLRGADELGAIAIGFSAGAIAATLSDLGTGSLLVREAARRPLAAGAFLGAGLALRMVTVPVTLLLVWVVAVVITPAAPVLVVLAAGGLIGQQTAELPRAVFNAHQRMAISSAHGIVENVVWLAVVAGGTALGRPLEDVFLLAALVWLGSLGVGLALVGHVLGVTPVWPGVGRLREMIMLARPFGAFAIVGIGYSRIDPLLIGLLLNGPALAAAGAYFGATRLLAAFEYLPEAVSRAAFPELVRRTVHEPDRIQTLLRTAAGALLTIGFAIPVVLVPAGQWLMALLYGPDPDRAGWVLGALSLIVPVRYVAYLLGVTLTSADAQGRRVAAASSALVVVIVVDVVGLPRVGLIAPVVAAALAGLVVLLVYARSVRQLFGTTGIEARTGLALAFATVVATFSGMGVASVAPPPIAAIAGLIVYLMIVLASPARTELRAVLGRRPA